MYDCTGKSAVSRMLSQEDNVTALLPFVEPKGWNFSTLSSSLSFLLFLSLLPAPPLFLPAPPLSPFCSSSLLLPSLLSPPLFLLNSSTCTVASFPGSCVCESLGMRLELPDSFYSLSH